MLPDEVPTLPVLVPFTAAAIAAVLGWLQRRGHFTALRALLGVVMCVYGAGVLGHVFLPLTIDTNDPRSWRVWLHLTPFIDVADDPIGIILNIALFVPLGLLLPLVVRIESARRALLCGFLISLGIEMAQFLGDLTVSPGRVADIDDLIGNTAGTLIGYAAYRLLMMIPVVARLLGRAALTPATDPVRL